MICLDSQRLGYVIGKLEWVTFREGVCGQTTPNMKIFVSHLVDHQYLHQQRILIAKYIGWLVSANSFPIPSSLLAYGTHEHTCHGGTDGRCTWAQQHGFIFTKTDLVQLLLGVKSGNYRDYLCVPGIMPFCSMTSQKLGDRWIASVHFYSKEWQWFVPILRDTSSGDGFAFPEGQWFRQSTIFWINKSFCSIPHIVSDQRTHFIYIKKYNDGVISYTSIAVMKYHDQK